MGKKQKVNQHVHVVVVFIQFVSSTVKIVGFIAVSVVTRFYAAAAAELR